MNIHQDRLWIQLDCLQGEYISITRIIAELEGSVSWWNKTASVSLRAEGIETKKQPWK